MSPGHGLRLLPAEISDRGREGPPLGSRLREGEVQALEGGLEGSAEPAQGLGDGLLQRAGEDAAEAPERDLMRRRVHGHRRPIGAAPEREQERERGSGQASGRSKDDPVCWRSAEVRGERREDTSEAPLAVLKTFS